LTDGYIPDEVFKRFGGTPLIRGYLTDAGFLHEDHVAAVLTAQHNRIRSASDVQAERKQSTDRVRSWRTKNKTASDQGQKVCVTPLQPDDTSEVLQKVAGNGLGNGVVTPNPSSQAESLPKPGTALAVPDKTRGTRLCDDWQPSESVKVDLRAKYPELKLGTVLEEFRDYWCAIPGQRGRKVDWDRTFRNRVREVADLPRYQRNGHQVRGADKKAADWQSLKERYPE
jgi:hypothetical protein